MAKDKKGGLAILIAGKPTDKEPVEDDYEGEDVPTDEVLEDEVEAAPETDYPEFDIPEGLDLSDLEEGDEKETLAVIRKKSDGTACIVSVDGVNLIGAEEELPEAPPETPPPPTAAPPAPMDIRGRAMGAGLM